MEALSYYFTPELSHAQLQTTSKQEYTLIIILIGIGINYAFICEI